MVLEHEKTVARIVWKKLPQYYEASEFNFSPPDGLVTPNNRNIRITLSARCVNHHFAGVIWPLLVGRLIVPGGCDLLNQEKLQRVILFKVQVIKNEREMAWQMEKGFPQVHQRWFVHISRSRQLMSRDRDKDMFHQISQREGLDSYWAREAVTEKGVP